MIVYLLKSAASLAVLMLFYKFLLEKENMHVFKRFYLLGAVVISFVIPLITFTSYVDMPAGGYSYIFEAEAGTGAEDLAGTGINLTALLWGIYSLGVLFFGIKFCRNLRMILLKIRKNPKFKAGNTTSVLLQEEVAPHTFWSYIFLNKKRYEKRQIPEEVFKHEQAHAMQKHSLDILFVEVLQVILWFHPLLYLVKRAIKLNHEFLADKAVIEKGMSTAQYQETLLAFSSGAINSSLVNSINYSSIKKRFTVMKTHTSKKRIWLRSLLLLPLLAGLLYSFSTRKMEITDPASASSDYFSSETLEISVDDKGIIRVGGKQMTLIEIRESLKPETYTNYAINASPSAPKELMEGLMQVVLKLRVEGSVTICSSGEESVNGTGVLNELFTIEEDQEKATPGMIAEYNKLAKFYREQGITEEIMRDEGFTRMMYIYSIMAEAQRKDAEKLPPPPPPQKSGEQLPPPPPPPSPEQAIKNWNAEGAEFYFGGEKISAQDALDLVRKGTKLQVKVDESGATKKIRLSLDKD